MSRPCLFAAIVVLGCAAASSGQGGAGATVLDFPHAGISLAVPQGYVVRPPATPLIVHATSPGSGARPRSITLSILAAAEKDTMDARLDEMLNNLKNNLSFKDVSMAKRVDTKIGSLPAKATLLSYNCRGDLCDASVTVFMRDVPGQRVRLAYILTVEMLTADQADLMPTFGAAVKSIRLTEFRHPADLPIGELGEMIEDFKGGCLIRAPHGWWVEQRSGGIVISQADFLRGQDATYRFQIQTAQVPNGTTGQGFIEGSIQSNPRARLVVIQAGAADVGDLPGYQAVMQPYLGRGPADAAASRPAGEPIPGGPKIFVIYRAACKAGDESRSDKLYSLVLISHGADVKKTVEAMDKIAGSVMLLKLRATTEPGAESRPASGPASRPASAPAESRPAPMPAAKP